MLVAAAAVRPAVSCAATGLLSFWALHIHQHTVAQKRAFRLTVCAHAHCHCSSRVHCHCPNWLQSGTSQLRYCRPKSLLLL